MPTVEEEEEEEEDDDGGDDDREEEAELAGEDGGGRRSIYSQRPERANRERLFPKCDRPRRVGAFTEIPLRDVAAEKTTWRRIRYESGPRTHGHLDRPVGFSPRRPGIFL